MTGSPMSTLALASDFHLNINVKEEACPLQLAPTSSTTATLAMGDALAVTLMNARGFKPENFARFHPGGSLGRRLLARVEDEMVTEKLPIVHQDSNILDLIESIGFGGLGLCIVDGDNRAIITDGDIRRSIETHGKSIFNISAKDIMTLEPASVPLGTRMEDALLLMDSRKITSLLITNDESILGVLKK